MEKRNISRALGLCLAVAAVSPATAVAQDLSSLTGPHEGAPMGGSSIVHAGADFFAPAEDLAQYEPGDVISERTIKYHVAGLPTPVDVVQIKYRSTDQHGAPTYNIAPRAPLRAISRSDCSTQPVRLPRSHTC
ncbi:hypothetical protein [Corynebacterium qintianiae]|uniref:hypothetical protein n=1 Tax=Corynebacterium qintianiae TaxID=2709392 RepID=UPI001F18EFD8|nr:hypothetical protein [Corynebacterium qintianiae]